MLVDEANPFRYNTPILLTFMRNFRFSCGIKTKSAVAAVFAAGVFLAAAEAAERPAPDLKAGKAAYGQYCARCHGETGKGDGVDARRFYPRPRDLSMGKYKFRTTATGTAPADEDLFYTVTYGLPGSNMPDWQHIDEATRWQLVEYLKSLSNTFADSPPQPVKLPADPGRSKADLGKGRQVYEQLGCAACHGAHGRANGPSAAGLVDEWNMPIRPANLTQGWAYRGGYAAKDIATRVLTGIDGANMPSYDGAITPPENVWQLAYYVESLQEAPNWNMIAHAQPVEGGLPQTADDPRWKQAELTTVHTRNAVTPEGEWAHPPTVRMVSLRALYNEETVAFRIEWDDPSHDPESPADHAAILLRPSGTQGDVVTLQAWPYAGASRLDICAWSSNNVQEAVEGVASDFESVIASPAQLPRLKSTASYEDGRWTLVVQRPLSPASPEGSAALTAGNFNAIAFAVWDGANDNARAVSPWVDLVLQKASH